MVVEETHQAAPALLFTFRTVRLKADVLGQ